MKWDLQRRADQAPPSKVCQSSGAGLETEGRVLTKLWVWLKDNGETLHFFSIKRMCFSSVQTVGPCSLLVDFMCVQPLPSQTHPRASLPQVWTSSRVSSTTGRSKALGEVSCTGIHFRAFRQFLCLPQFPSVEIHLSLSISASLSHLSSHLTGPTLTCMQALGAQSNMGPANIGASMKAGKARSSPDHGE